VKVKLTKTGAKLARALMPASALTALLLVVSLGLARRFVGDPVVASVKRQNQGVAMLQPYKDPDSEEKLRFYEQRVAGDPDDINAENALATECLRRLRITGNLVWLHHALEASERSLESVPAVTNFEGLANAALVQTELHHFAESRDMAKELCTMQPRNPKCFEALGDALLELGDYEAAASVYQMAQQLAGEHGQNAAPEVNVRLAHLDWIRGDDPGARSRFAAALTFAQIANPPYTEMIAFCHVQLGQLDFSSGDWSSAEAHYRAALVAIPSYYPAIEHLAELTGAKGNYDLAIQLYKEVIENVPRPEFDQMLADLYLYLKQPDQAKPWEEKAEAAYLASVKAGDVFYYHNLASFYADTAQEPAKAVEWARKDIERIQTVFAFEGLGWALYRNGNYVEATNDFDHAVALGTRSPHLLYEAGTTYFRAGNIDKGKKFLRLAYTINPRFDTFHVHR
jgi:tetratricopeptide (TPR) repeat protein